MSKPAMSEFELIKRYFVRPTTEDSATSPMHQGVALGIGDDCALLQPAGNMELAISTDLLVEGRHFFPGADPEALGHKALAVNLSDLAAMGATPVGFTLALAMPVIDTDWLDAFSTGLFALADMHGCTLIGGDTTKGPLTICITVFGEVAQGSALRRDKAVPGDDIWVSGSLGDARLALAALRNELVNGLRLALSPEQLKQALHCLHRPTPRLALGIALRGAAHAAIDISDGLGGDLGHILERSNCGATINIDALPVGPALQMQSMAVRRAWSLSGGDDYELCFTAPPQHRTAIAAVGLSTDTALSRIGAITSGTGLKLVDAQGAELAMPFSSFDHFHIP